MRGGLATDSTVSRDPISECQGAPTKDGSYLCNRHPRLVSKLQYPFDRPRHEDRCRVDSHRDNYGTGRGPGRNKFRQADYRCHGFVPFLSYTRQTDQVYTHIHGSSMTHTNSKQLLKYGIWGDSKDEPVPNPYGTLSRETHIWQWPKYFVSICMIFLGTVVDFASCSLPRFFAQH